ncbi:MAG TPA: diguanylate cyclase [Pantanalinema sp.]
MKRWTIGKAYFFAVTVLGLGLAAWMLADASQYAQLAHPMFLAFALLGVATELVGFPLPRGGRVTASFAFLFASLLMQGLFPTIVVIALIAVASNLVVQRRHWSLALFNLAQYTLSYGAAHLALVLGGYEASRDLLSPLTFGVLFAATLAQIAVNIALVNGYIALEKQVPLWQVLWEDDRYELLATLLLSPLSVTMVVLYQRAGLMGAALLVGPLLVTAVLWVLYLKVRQSRRALEVANQELAILNQIAQRISSRIDLGESLVLIGNEIKRAVPHDACMIFLLDPSNHRLVRARTQAIAVEKTPDAQLGQGLIGKAAQGAAIVRLDALQDLLSPGEDHLASYHSALIAPILAEDKRLGVIALFNHDDRAFDARSERLLGIIASYAAIAIQNAQLYQTTQQLAITDGLTAVYNRRYFQRQLDNEFRRAPRFGYPIALILLDVDHFKQFNDTHGHLLGDQVLRSMAQILKESVRETDVVARYGGEEFAVILPETTRDHALEVAERIRKNVAHHTFWGRGQTPVQVTVSIGVASRLAAETSAEAMIELSDQALYEAKRTGRDRICVAGSAEDGVFHLAPPRPDEQGAAKRRATGRARIPLDAEAWGATFALALPPLLLCLESTLSAQGHSLEPDAQDQWRDRLGQLLETLARQVARPETVDPSALPQLGLEAPVSHLIQLGMTLTQSEHLVLSLCQTLDRHVQEAPYSPQARLQVLAEVERFTHALQLEVSQVWHAFYQQTNSQLLAIQALEDRISGAHALDELLLEGVKVAMEALEAQAVLLFMPQPGQDHLRMRAASGLDEIERVQWLIPCATGPVGEAMATMQPRILPGGSALDAEVLTAFCARIDAQQAALFPLVHQGEAQGVLLCLGASPDRFGPSSLRLGRGIAGRMAAAIARIQAQDSRQDTYLQAIVDMVEALEAKDGFATGHSENLVRCATALGEALGLGAEDLAVLHQAAYLHDLGKIAFPEAILAKPGRLTPQERTLVESHPEIGARLIGSIASLRSVVPIVRHHHEHWNGTGYPDGLAGEEIPLLARILAVAEAFEGMTAPKPYRPAYAPHEALAEMRSSGNFDPAVLDVLEPLVLRQTH